MSASLAAHDSPMRAVPSRGVQAAGVWIRPDGYSQRLKGCGAEVARDIWHAAELAGVIEPGEPLPETFTDDQVRRMLAFAPGAGGNPVYSGVLSHFVIGGFLGICRKTVWEIEQRAIGKLRADAELVAAMGDVAVERARSGGLDAVGASGAGRGGDA